MRFMSALRAWWAVFLLAPALLAPSPARADVVTVVSVSGKGLGLSSNGQEVTHLKGKQMRRDLTERGKAISYLYDLEQRRLTVLNHSKREAEVYPMAALAAEVRSRTQGDKLELKLEPTGATKEILGRPCFEYRLQVSVPARMAGGDVLVRQVGTAWLAKGGTGASDFNTFWKATAGGELFLGVPSQAKSVPGQVLGAMAFYQKAAEIGPVYALSLEFRYEGAAAVAEVMRKTVSSLSQSMVSISTDPVPDDRFSIPRGYTVKSR